MNQMESDWITMKDAWTVMGIARNTVKKLIHDGTLPVYTIQRITCYKLKLNGVEAVIQLVIAEPPKKKGSRKTKRTKPRPR